MKLKLDITPYSTNSLYRVFRGRSILKKDARDFKRKMKEMLKTVSFQKILGPVKVKYVFAFENKRKRDLDNYFKPITDSLKDMLFEDDDHIYSLKGVKMINQKCNYVKIEIEPLTPDKIKQYMGL
jgi:Holliday junction resolvase RusA-like endonuclease